jgi:hypothetical protein
MDEVLCEQCGHLFDVHVLSVLGDPIDALLHDDGMMTCPVEGCDCVITVGFSEEQKDAIRRASGR